MSSPEKMKPENVYKPLEHSRSVEVVRETTVRLKSKADMNDVFVPIKCDRQEILDVIYVQSSVP